MRQQYFEVTCEVCGGKGLGDIHAAGAEWLTDRRVVHNNPEVCRQIIEQKAKEKNSE